jgi:hypothetical protein
MMNTTAQVTHWQALEVGRVFLSHPHVYSVSVVGSVARHKRGNDLDMVVVTTGICYASFMTRVREWLQCDATGLNYYEHKEVRHRAALVALQFDAGFCGWLALATKGFSLDVHLMPWGWMGHVEEVQRHLPHHDPSFVRNIAKDAVQISTVFCVGDMEYKEVSWP